LFRDERTPQAVQLEAWVVENGAYVPPLWALEVANVLVLAARKGRIDQADVTGSLARLARLGIMPSPHQPEIQRVAELATKHGLTTYDALYLAHAMALQLPLASLDRDLTAAARAEAVTVLGTS
jgi:predicted nucleic acid-binding protein